MKPRRILAATSVALLVTLGTVGCASDDSAPADSSETSASQETVDPDITDEQLAFVDELLAEPLPEDEATAMIEEAGYSWRLGTIDGEPQAVTMDYRIDRLTLTTQDGLVIDAAWG